MRGAGLQQMPGLDPKLIPPRGAKQVGMTDDDRPIYELENWYDPHLSSKNKVPVLDADGEEVWRKHPTTGDKLTQVMRIKPVYRTRRFVLEGTRNGHVLIVEGFEATAATKKTNAKVAARQRFNDELAEIATEQGMSAGEFVRTILGRAKVAVAEEIAGTEDFPVNRTGGWWLLSNGMKHKGDRASAEKAEALLVLEAEATIEEDFMTPVIEEETT